MDRLPSFLAARSAVYVVLIVFTVLAGYGLRMGDVYLNLNILSVDGAFQTYSTLKHISDEQKPFIAYFPYLGMIASAIPYPVFALTGGTLFGSVAATYFMTYTVGISSLFLLFRINRFSIPLCIVLALAVLLACLYFPLMPGNSLRPLRAALPFVIAFFLHVIGSRARSTSPDKSNLSTGFMFGVGLAAAPLWSADFGVASLIAFSAAWALFVAEWRRPLSAMAGLVSIPLVAFAGTYVLLLLFSDPAAWWAFQKQMADYQFWYFGPWGQPYQALDAIDALRFSLALTSPTAPAAVLAVILALASLTSILLRRAVIGSDNRWDDGLIFAIGLATYGGCLASQLGGHAEPGYWDQLVPVALSLAVIEASNWRRSRRLFDLVAGYARAAMHRFMPARLNPIDVAFGALCLVFLAYNSSILARGFLSMNHDLAARDALPAPQRRAALGDRSTARDVLGAYPRNDARAVACFARAGALFDAAAVPADKRVTSTYLSALNVAAGAKQPMQVDSMIHALGDTFRTANFDRVKSSSPVVVTTLNPEYMPWERWNEVTAWPFFRYVYSEFYPAFRSDQHLIWLPRSITAAAPASRGDSTAGAVPCSVRQDTPQRTVLAVDIETLPVPTWGVVSAEISVRRTDGAARLSRPALLVDDGGDGTRRLTAIGPPYPPRRYGVDAQRSRLEITLPMRAGSNTPSLSVQPEGWSLSVKACTAKLEMPVAGEPVDRIPRLEDCDTLLQGVRQAIAQRGYPR